MKLKTIIYSICISLAFIACNDQLSSVGSEIQPEGDRLNVRTDTISFTSSSQVVDSIFIKTSRACLGSFNDPLYGIVKYGYLTNFYTSPTGVFDDEVIGDRIDSVLLRLQYYYFVGDSLTPMGATVREVTKPLAKNFYSNINPLDYVDESVPAWADTTYTARNMNLSDSAYSTTTYRDVVFKLPNTVGEKIYNEWKRTPDGKETFANLDEFFKFFPGVYIESTFGSGNILKIDHTSIEVYYQTHIMGNVSGKVDSLVTHYALFDSSEEATLLNIIDKADSKERDQELASDENYTYLKTPSGVITQLEISLQDIVDKVGDNRIYNNVGLTLAVEDQSSWQYTLPMPSTVLLISPDSVKQFFEQARLASSNYSYIAGLATSSAYKYDFGNIANLIQNSIQNMPQSQWPLLKLWVIPVEILYDPSSSYYTTGAAYATNNYFTPSGAKLKTGRENLKLYITTTKTNK